MSFTRVLSVSVAFLAVSVSAYDYKSYNTRSCTASNARCAGAPGKPYIQYAPCCDTSMGCMPMPNASADQWGLYCVAPAAPVRGAPAASTCYASGERCMGAPGMPYVKYMACCAAGDSCSAKAGDWGGFCQSGGGSAPSSPSSPYSPYSPRSSHSKCYNTGERCMGETGYPYVQYKACCTASESCVKSTTTWGSVCTAASAPATPVVTPAAPTGYYGKVTTVAPSSPIAALLAELPGLSPDFCSPKSNDPAAVSNVQPPFQPTDEKAVIELSLPLADCGATEVTFSAADAEAFCQSVLAKVLETDPDAACRYVSVDPAEAPVRQLVQGDELELDASERQLGFVLIIQIIVGQSFFTLILLILGPFVIFLGGFVSPLPTVTSEFLA